ncbi:MAG: thioredoxin family protein [Candidatus Eiseniibacteriota bacterium]
MRRLLALLAAFVIVAAGPQVSKAAEPPPADKAPSKSSTKSGGSTPKADAPTKADADKIEWLAFDAAATKAKAQEKHMIVDIYTTWCGWCKVMERETYANPQVVAYLHDNFILAKVNGESSAKLRWKGRDLTERQFAKTVGVNGYPSTYFFKPNAELLGGMSGFLMPPDFMIYAQYVATRYYEKGKIQAYADSIRATAKQPETTQQ